MGKNGQYPVKCAKCGNEWKAKTPQGPKICKKCGTSDWRTPTETRNTVKNPGVKRQKAPSKAPSRQRTMIEREMDARHPEGWKNPAEAMGEEAEQPIVPVIPKKIPVSRSEKRRLEKQARLELKAERDAERLEKKEEKRRRKQEAKGAPKEKRDRKAPKEQLWSEKHPQGWKEARTLLPRLHMVIFAIVLSFLITQELGAGNYDFALDWYQASFVLPAMVEVLQSQAYFEEWLNQYGPEFFVVMAFIVTALLVFYTVAWRAAFKNYVKYSEGEPKPEGRCYWRTNNGWTRLWDRLYHSPPRTMNTYWINQGRFLNILNPPASLIRLDTSIDETCEEKGLWKIQVNEKRIRRKVNNSSRHLTTADELYANGMIPTDYVDDRFKDMTVNCVTDTKKLTHANPNVRIEVVRGGTSLVMPEFKEAVLNARRKRAERDKDIAK